MKFKKGLALMAGLFSILSLTSCGDKTTTTASDGGIIKEKTKITVWTTMGKTKINWMNSMIEKFKEEEPNVEIEHTAVSGNYTTLKENIVTGFSADNYPNMTYGYPDHVAEYFDYRKVVNMEPYVNNTEYGWTSSDTSDIYSRYIDEMTDYAGPDTNGVYSLPFAKSSEMLYYNADKLIGLILPGVNNGRGLTDSYFSKLTWDEFFNVLCPAIMTYQETTGGLFTTSEDYQNKIAVLGYDSADNLYITLSKQLGYPYTELNTSLTNKGNILWNSAEGKELGAKIYEWASKKYITTPDAVEEDYTSTLFTANACLFTISSTAGTSYLASSIKVGAAMIPQKSWADGEQQYAMNQGPSFIVLDRASSTDNGTSDNQKLACWLFYKYMVNAQNNLTWAAGSGYFPIRQSVAESTTWTETYNPETISDKTSAEYIAALTYSKADEISNIVFSSPAFDKSSKSRDAVDSIVELIITAARAGNTFDYDKVYSEQYNIAIN